MTSPQVTGGYHDAGDHVKFGFPMASMTVRMTLILILSQAEKILCKNDFTSTHSKGGLVRIYFNTIPINNYS